MAAISAGPSQSLPVWKLSHDAIIAPVFQYLRVYVEGRGAHGGLLNNRRFTDLLKFVMAIKLAESDIQREWCGVVDPARVGGPLQSPVSFEI